MEIAQFPFDTPSIASDFVAVPVAAKKAIKRSINPRFIATNFLSDCRRCTLASQAQSSSRLNLCRS